MQDFNKTSASNKRRNAASNPSKINGRRKDANKSQTYVKLIQKGGQPQHKFHEIRDQENDAEKNAVPTSSSRLPGVISLDGLGGHGPNILMDKADLIY